jgi:hypothetical protein
MRPREVADLRKTEHLYTTRPHVFRALGPSSPTCSECGNTEKHPLHVPKSDSASPTQEKP